MATTKISLRSTPTSCDSTSARSTRPGSSTEPRSGSKRRSSGSRRRKSFLDAPLRERAGTRAAKRRPGLVQTFYEAGAVTAQLP
jgi:hypothetical protein